MTSQPPESGQRHPDSTPWTRPPEQPAPYRLSTRLSDMMHGWLDGRRGLPRLPQPVPASPGAGSVPPDTAGSATGPGEARRDRSPLDWLRTAKMAELSDWGLELISGERIAYLTDCAELKRERDIYRALCEAAAEKTEIAKKQLDAAREPLSSQESGRRRLAEADSGARPDSLVRGRRQAAWERRVRSAEREYQVAAEAEADAGAAVLTREAFLRDRAAVARAAAERYHELAQRRIATYLQQLVRSHRHGADLNLLLMRYPVGPDLPEWTREPAEAAGEPAPCPPGGEPHGIYPGDETSRR